MTFETLKSLRWSGRAWPAATITGPIRVVVKDATGTERRGAALEIATTGQGRTDFLWGPSSFWRSFAESDPADPDTVRTFVKRHGDPFDVLSPDTPSDTSGWSDLIELLRPAADCWFTLDREGEVESLFACDDDPRAREQLHEAREPLLTSRYIDQLRLQRVPHFVSASELPNWHIEDPDNASIEMTGLAIVAQSLAAYMVGSALADLEAEQDMARCLHCREWFALKRRDARFCSASCRALYSTARKGEK